jgi:hypothetical protein
MMWQSTERRAAGPDGMMNGGARQAVFGADETEQPAKN